MKLSRRLALFIAAPLLSLAAPAFAQDTSALETPEAFRATFTALARQLQAPILLEGYPLRPRGTVARADQSFTDPVASLAEAAQVNDYAVSRSNGCYLLSKRYSTPRDLPCATLPELRQSLDLIRAALGRFYTPIPMPEPTDPKDRRDYPGFVMLKLYAVLKDHPARKSGNGMIPLSEAGPEARQFLEQAWGYQMFGTLYNVLAYDAPLLTDKAQIAPFEGRTELRGYLERGLQTTLSPTSDSPLPALRPRDAMPTLDAAVKEWNARPGAKQIILAPALEDKPLTAFGCDSAPSEDIARSVGVLYRLSVTANADLVQIAPRRVPLPENAKALGRYAANVLPPSVSRLLFADFYREDVTDLGGGQFRGISPLGSIRQAAYEVVGGAYRREWEAGGQTSVPVSALTPYERTAYALCVYGYLPYIQQLTQRVELPFSDELARGRVSIRIEEGKTAEGEPRIAIHFYQPQGNGNDQMIPAFGVGNIKPYGP